MNNLKIYAKNIKGISEAELELPITNGIFAFVGENGSGKSTLLQAFAQLIRPQNALYALKYNDYDLDSQIKFQGFANEDSWIVNKNHCWINTEKFFNSRLHANNIKIYGMYEGSLFVGTRFSDSTFVDKLYSEKKINAETDLVRADEYVIENLSYILHGDKEHYATLKRLKNKKLRENLHLKNLPYFIDSRYGGLISQYRMSSGECLLISLLHFIYNSIIRKSLPTNTPVLMLLDEIELALHPSAVNRFLDLIKKLVNEYNHVSVFLTTHASEVIKKIDPDKIYKIENNNGKLSFVNPCYPAYAIRELYGHDRYDYMILCEDILTKKAIENTLQKNNLRNSKLICVCPVGGWENVLKLHLECVQNNILGLSTNIISILDGDIKDECCKKNQYTDLKKLFLPISSIEKCLFDILYYEKYGLKLKKEINDALFTCKSIDTIKSEFIQDQRRPDNKSFYNYIKKDLSQRKIDEGEFIKTLLDILYKYTSFKNFEEQLEKALNS